MLDDLEKSVLKIYEECIGKNEANISTIDMLRHIELRMENLTQEQEILNPKKVWTKTTVGLHSHIMILGGDCKSNLWERKKTQGEGGKNGKAKKDGGE